MKELQKFGLDEVCALTGFPKRTVRYYIQLGLVDRPEGSKRGAYYTGCHLEQLLAVKTWQRSGLSLERIRELLGSEDAALAVPAKGRGAGTVEVWSHMVLGDGLELHVEPGQAELNPKQLRALARGVRELMDGIRSADPERGKES